MPFDATQLSKALQGIGCPEDKCPEMAAQLLKRATQLSAQTGRTEEEALMHLLTLMRQGWSAKERGL